MEIMPFALVKFYSNIVKIFFHECLLEKSISRHLIFLPKFIITNTACFRFPFGYIFKLPISKLAILPVDVNFDAKDKIVIGD